MWLLDLYCGGGGGAQGYVRAGFKVIGIDNQPQKYYPFEFIQADALEVLRELIANGGYLCGKEISAIHASPPCQAYAYTRTLSKKQHPELIEPTRDLLEQTNLPYIIENVPESPLINPIMLCGASFPELNTYRHRLFECNWPARAPEHQTHRQKNAKLNTQPQPGERIFVVGNMANVEAGRAAMNIGHWLPRTALVEAIPPAYTEYIGRQLYARLRNPWVSRVLYPLDPL